MLIVPEKELQRLREENERLRYERDEAESKLFNTAWKLAEAEELLQSIEEWEEYMRADGRLIDPLKPNRKQQAQIINECERRELEAK